MFEMAPIQTLGPDGIAVTVPFAALLSFCLPLVLYKDRRRFEINCLALAVAAFGMGALILMLSGPVAVLEAVAVGALLGALTEGLRPVMARRDPPVFALFGLTAGPDHVAPALLAAALITTLFAGGRWLRDPTFSVVPGLVMAMSLVVLLRGLEAMDVMPRWFEDLAIPLGTGPATAVLALSLTFLAGLWTGARQRDGRMTDRRRDHA